MVLILSKSWFLSAGIVAISLHYIEPEPLKITVSHNWKLIESPDEVLIYFHDMTNCKKVLQNYRSMWR